MLKPCSLDTMVSPPSADNYNHIHQVFLLYPFITASSGLQTLSMATTSWLRTLVLLVHTNRSSVQSCTQKRTHFNNGGGWTNDSENKTHPFHKSILHDRCSTTVPVFVPFCSIPFLYVPIIVSVFCSSRFRSVSICSTVVPSKVPPRSHSYSNWMNLYGAMMASPGRLDV